MIRTFLFIFSLCLLLAWPFANSHAGKTRRGACRAPIPSWSKEIGPNRYVAGFNSPQSMMRFYRKIFGRNAKYPNYTIVMSESIIAYHLKSRNKKTKWKGVNLVFFRYRRKNRYQVYVTCRKKK